jgi:ADP-heptose:LPS heptosyltransferase/glycosyltransferase involved in cell wall biosynthesis/SAM-dependent methyltransferase
MSMCNDVPCEPLASCITPTANRRRLLPQAIQYFLRQDYSNKELIIVDDGEDGVSDVVPHDERIRYIRLPCKTVLGEKRNRAVAEARGEIIVHWDDDDWSAPWRLHYQLEELVTNGADICGLDRIFFYASEQRRAWQYIYPAGQRLWVYGASLAYRKVFWKAHPFPKIAAGEDTSFVWADARAKIHVLKDPRCLVALIHHGNCSPKRTSDLRYQPRPVEEIEGLLGDDLRFYAHPTERSNGSGASLAEARPKPTALVSAARGVGDILRVTPLIRVIHRLGYEVDVLLATDYADAVELLQGAPEIRKLFHLPSPRRGEAPSQMDGLSNETYDVATFTTWSASLRGRVQARNVHLFERDRWLAEGDSRCVERIAHDLGWPGEIPPPFAMGSNRKFGLLPGTIAIHPGCKYEWPWKKWHGFDELARLFSNVVIVGTEEDLRTVNTYFEHPFSWPENVQNFVGKLGLSDTAALLQECAALVSNDSGLMHLGVALGVPTFGIFGITSPDRETISAPNMFPITKGLPCEPACRQGAWGRRDCEYHLRCLKTLTPDEVYMKVTATLPELKKRSLALSERVATPRLDQYKASNEAINVAYYGYVFDASGYGQAARAYLHALHQAGIALTVVDLASSRARQVEDPLVDSLIGQPTDVDFHLFHGTPPFWARQAFPLRNVIAMTVWETDTMPTQWRPILAHAIDVWLPCEFNSNVFSAALGKPVFKLPHPVFLAEANGDAADEIINDGEIQPDDFVFYSIFEWQDRKSPERTMEAYFRAFREEDHTLLVLKTNPGAAAVAARALAEMRRRTGSRARATVHAEAWSEAQIAALHARGDCYVSLHRGEGWGYPLFEAASRGNPVIATGYSGPLDFLAADAHCLVRHTLTAVRQPYAYYRPSMNWAEPDIIHATELMRAIRTEPEEPRKRATEAAKGLVRDFSLDAIGQRAKRRLFDLLRRTDNAKWERLDRAQRTGHLRPALPIPGEWFDADYFEHGVKSNWKNGYHWRDFASLFRDTAQFLVMMFPEAASFLDAGCAKGFLVRALRELGKDAWGFDHSKWALERAEELARPFLRQACAESVEFDRRFDLTLAFSLLENLTEEQALEFLRRARTWTSQALVVVLLVCNDEAERTRLLADDRDLARVTLQSRAWWHERFLRAEWRQDALHRSLQRLCQADPLPARMGWELFVYARV